MVEEENKEVETVEDQYLDSSEMVQMELYQAELKIHAMKMVEVKKDIALKEMQKQINMLKNELLSKAVESDKLTISNEQKKLNDKKEQNQNNNKHIADKYKLDGAWGYNPDTGLIIKED